MAIPDNLAAVRLWNQYVLQQVVLLSVLLMAALVAPPYSAATVPEPVRIGVLAKRGSEQALRQWQPTAVYLSEQIPEYRFVIVPLDFDAVRAETMAGRIEFLITNSAYYVILEYARGLSRIATMANLHGTQVQHRFGGVIFTRAGERDIQTLKDLSGKRFCAVDPDSLGGWLAAWREFHDQGIDPERDFQGLDFTGTHDAVVEAVLSGTHDAGTVRTDTLERMVAEGRLELSSLRILNQQPQSDFSYQCSTRLYPEWPFAVLPHTPRPLARQVALALLAMTPGSSAARAAQVGGWTVPLDYQPIHDLFKTLHLAQYRAHIGSPSLLDIMRQYWGLTTLLAGVFTVLLTSLVYGRVLNRRLDRRINERSRQLEREISERHEAEERLKQAEKMEAIGMMASGVAHDLNNILSGIVSYPELLLLRLPEDSPLRRPVVAIKESGLRAADVVADLLTVARDAARVRSRVNLNTLVLEYLQSLEHQKIIEAYPEIVLHTALDPNLPPLCCSPTHVNKCLMNLVLNAAEAMTGAGRITVGTARRSLDQNAAAELDLTPGQYLALTIKDNGAGIPAADLKRIFEPFYTKKKMGRSGTGIGLAVVWNAMQNHQGAVVARSGPEGSEFTLYFPLEGDACVEQAVAETGEEAVTPAVQGRGERILVVDDDARQRDIARQILSSLNYRVVTADNGEAALEELRRRPADLLILDMVMDPGIDGSTTYRRVLAINPAQKALFLSGYTEDAKVQEALALGPSRFLKKPYQMEHLGQAVRQLLDEPSRTR